MLALSLVTEGQPQGLVPASVSVLSRLQVQSQGAHARMHSRTYARTHARTHALTPVPERAHTRGFSWTRWCAWICSARPEPERRRWCGCAPPSTHSALWGTPARCAGACADVRSGRWQALRLHVACRSPHGARSMPHTVGGGAHSTVLRVPHRTSVLYGRDCATARPPRRSRVGAAWDWRR